MSIKELKKKLAVLRTEMKEKGAELIKADFAEFFAANPKVTAIAWTQYAPYFNDGDACTFSVHEFQYTTAPESEVDNVFDELDWGEPGDSSGAFVSGPAYESYDYETKTFVYRTDVDPEEVAVGKNLAQLERDIVEDDLFETIFGSDCSVMVRRDGSVKIGEFSHD